MAPITLKLAAAAAIFAVAVVGQIPPAPMRTVWEGMFPPPYIQSPEIALAMDCVSASQCYLAGGSNGVGFGVYKYDGEMNGNIEQMNIPNMSMIVMDIAMGGSLADPHGAFSSVVDFTIGAGLQYLANKGTVWLPSAMPFEVVWASQSISGDAAGKNFVAVGNGFANSLMVSSDYGVTFKEQPLTVSISDNCSAPGYLAMPAPNVWFLTWASAPSRNDSNVDLKYYNPRVESIVGRRANGQVLLIKNRKSGEVRTHTKSLKQLRADRLQSAAAKRADKCNYYAGWILKSTDQGKSWKQVYTNTAFATSYVVCGSATNCVVTAFNDDRSYTITTTDGESWRITYTTPAATNTQMTALQAVGYASATEVWAAGSVETQTSGAGIFWYSKDAGVTWTPYEHQIPDIAVIMAVDFADGVGFALGLTMFKTAQIMRYKNQPDYGYFIQSQCPLPGCTVLCQNISFPQGMCLSAQGGSVKAICTPSGVEQYFYETTSCVGSYTKNVDPINVCINGTNTYFENYCPPAGADFSQTARRATAGDVLRR